MRKSRRQLSYQQVIGISQAIALFLAGIYVAKESFIYSMISLIIWALLSILKGEFHYRMMDAIEEEHEKK